MNNSKYISLSVALACCMVHSVQATDYRVRQAGGDGYYNTIGAAYGAALANTAGSHRVLIQDNGPYVEVVDSTVHGTAGVNITIEPEGDNTPNVYAIKLYEDAANITLRKLALNGSLGTGAEFVLHVLGSGGGNGANVIEDCTIDGRGTSNFSVDVRATKNGQTELRNCTFGTNTTVYAGFAPNQLSCTNATLAFTGNRFNCLRDIASAVSIVPTQAGGTGCKAIFSHNIFNKNRGGLTIRQTLAEPYLAELVIRNNTFYRCGDLTSEKEGALWLEDYAAAPTKTMLGAKVFNNLFRGGDSLYSPNSMDGISTGVTPTDVDFDNNGFYMNTDYTFNVDRLAMLVSYSLRAQRTSWKNVAQMNADYASTEGNVEGDSDPFVNAESGDFTLVKGCWATTASDTGGYIGAVPPPSRSKGTFILLR